jgi:hypothetical protein
MQDLYVVRQKVEIFVIGVPRNSVGIETGYRLNGRVIESQCERDFPNLSKRTLGPTQPPGQMVPCLSRG